MDLYVVEPQTLFISYLTDVLARADMDVVRIATAFDLDDIERAHPGAVFVDTDFLDSEPVSVVETLRGALPEVLIFAYVGDQTHSFGELLNAAGATGVISKHSSAAEVVSGIRNGIATGRYLDPRLSEPASDTPDEVRYVDLRSRQTFEANG